MTSLIIDVRVTSYTNFIHLYQGHNISRTLERIESNSKQPYYTTLTSEDTLVWFKKMIMIMTEMKLQVKGIVYFFENTSNIPNFKISDTFFKQRKHLLYLFFYDSNSAARALTCIWKRWRIEDDIFHLLICSRRFL